MTQSAAFLQVRLGARRVGLPLRDIVAVEAVGTVYPVPAIDASCRGVISTRGRLMPVLELGKLIDAESSEGGGGTGIIFQIEGRNICLEVDEAEAIVHGDLLPLPPGEPLPWASAVVRRPEGLIPLVDLTALGERLIIPEASV